ncbi:MAG: hypothetical protein ACTSRA_06625, partial [Promethearchaeota archaeon]
MRNISEKTNLSQKKVKNILQYLEKSNQIERVIEKNKNIPKWRITKTGKRMLKKSGSKNSRISYPTLDKEMLAKIHIYKDPIRLKEACKDKQEVMNLKLKTLYLEMNKALRLLLNVNEPFLEDLLGSIISRIKYFRQRLNNLLDPLAAGKISKLGEKSRRVSKEEEKYLLVEILFFNSLIIMEITRFLDFNEDLTNFLENKNYLGALTCAQSLHDELTRLATLINARESININSHVLSKDTILQISKNKFSPDILNNIFRDPIEDGNRLNEIKELILKFIASIN